MRIKTTLHPASTVRRGHLESLAAEFGRLDLGAELLTAPREAIAHARTVADAQRDKPAQLTSTTGRLAAQLAAGELTVDQAVDAVAGQQSHAAAVESIRALLASAAEIAEQRAVQAFRTAGEALLGVLDAEVKRIAARAGVLAVKVQGVTSDAQALTGGRAARDAWAELTNLAGRADSVQGLADDLRKYRLVEVERSTMKCFPVELHYAQPWRLITDRERANLGHVVPQLLADLAAEPREATHAEWVADSQRIEAGYQANADAELDARQAAADHQARILNANLAAAHERAEARHAASV